MSLKCDNKDCDNKAIEQIKFIARQPMRIKKEYIVQPDLTGKIIIPTIGGFTGMDVNKIKIKIDEKIS